MEQPISKRRKIELSKQAKECSLLHFASFYSRKLNKIFSTKDQKKERDEWTSILHHYYVEIYAPCTRASRKFPFKAIFLRPNYYDILSHLKLLNLLISRAQNSGKCVCVSLLTLWYVPCPKCSFFDQSNHEQILAFHCKHTRGDMKAYEMWQHKNLAKRDVTTKTFLMQSFWHEDSKQLDSFNVYFSWIPEEVVTDILSLMVVNDNDDVKE
jgi:hypothetical protein